MPERVNVDGADLTLSASGHKLRNREFTFPVHCELIP
jgi:hypothetical protein